MALWFSDVRLGPVFMAHCLCVVRRILPHERNCCYLLNDTGSLFQCHAGAVTNSKRSTQCSVLIFLHLIEASVLIFTPNVAVAINGTCISENFYAIRYDTSIYFIFPDIVKTKQVADFLINIPLDGLSASPLIFHTNIDKLSIFIFFYQFNPSLDNLSYLNDQRPEPYSHFRQIRHTVHSDRSIAKATPNKTFDQNLTDLRASWVRRIYFEYMINRKFGAIFG